MRQFSSDAMFLYSSGPLTGRRGNPKHEGPGRGGGTPRLEVDQYPHSKALSEGVLGDKKYIAVDCCSVYIYI